MNVNDTLDHITDLAVPGAMDAIEGMGMEVTIEDREALSDWLQDRFRRRVEDMPRADHAGSWWLRSPAAAMARRH